MLLMEREDGIKLLSIESADDMLPFRASFAGAYQTVFADPPYQERIYPTEALAVIQQHLSIEGQITVIAVQGEMSVIGFGMACPLHRRPDIVKQLRGLLPIKHTMYFAELGVLEQHRRMGIGGQLTKLRLDQIDRNLFQHVVLRTSASRDPSYEMYANHGFQDMGVYSDISARRTDGSVRTDRRLFLSRMFGAP